MSARLGCRVGLLSALSFLAGCQSQSRSPANPESLVAAADRPAALPHSAVLASPENSPGALPDALSQKTAEYARSMEGSAGQRQTGPGAPSAVRWEQSAPASATSPPISVAAANTPAAVPSVAPTGAPPTPRAAASVKIAADEPAIVPESSDFEGAQPAAARITAQPSDTFEADIERRVHESPQDASAQLDYQLLQMLKDGSGAELASLSSASPEDREIIAALTDGIANFRTAVRQDNNLLLSAKIKPLLDMSDRLRSLAELTVNTAVLCKRVRNFGSYEVMDDHFRAGRENATIVYSEIEDFTSRKDANAKWEAKLSQQVSLYTDAENSVLVWKDRVHEVPDVCSERRHDFYMYDLVRLPANLTIGRYVLKVTIVDELANHVAEKTLPLEIVADPADAAVSSSLTVAPN